MHTTGNKTAKLKQVPVHTTIRHRRHSGLPIRIPLPGIKAEAAKSKNVTQPPPRGLWAPEKVKALQEKYKDIPPQEREIIRKLGYRVKNALAFLFAKAGINTTPAPLTPQPVKVRATVQAPKVRIAYQGKQRGSDPKCSISMLKLGPDETGSDQSTPQNITGSEESLPGTCPTQSGPPLSAEATPVSVTHGEVVPESETINNSLPCVTPAGCTIESIRPLSYPHPVKGYTMEEARRLGLAGLGQLRSPR